MFSFAHSHSVVRRGIGAVVLTAMLMVTGSGTATVALPERAPEVAQVDPVEPEPAPEAPAVTGMSPASGAAGTTVVLDGSGFGATPAENDVRLNGVTAAVTDASTTRLLVTVPDAAGSGPFVVTTSTGEASSSDFVVPPAGLATTQISSTKRITAGGEGVEATISVADQIALMLFDGVPGQRVTLNLTGGSIGTSSCCAAKVSIRTPSGGVLLAPTWMAKTGVFVDVQTLTLEGTYTIVIDPEGAATGSVTATLYDVPADAGFTGVPGGEPVSVSTTTPGQNAIVSFEGTAGQRVSVRATSVSFGTSSCCGAKVSVLRPDGTTLLSPVNVGTAGGWIEPLTLGASGTYVMRIDPQSFATGSGVFQIFDVPDDSSGGIVPDGEPVRVETTVPGQNATLTFDAAADDRIALQATAVAFGSSSCCSIKVSILRPDGTAMYGPVNVGTSGGWSDVLSVAVAGRYTIKVDPQSANFGSASLRLLVVPPDQIVTATPDGTAATAETTVPGQNGYVGFDAEAGNAASVKLTNVAMGTSSCCSVKVSVLTPSGGTLVAATNVGTSGGFLDRVDLPLTGRYFVKLDVQGTGVGSAKVQVFTVPPDPAPQVVPGGDPVLVTTTVPGQNAAPTFDGLASQRVSVKLRGATFGTSSSSGAKLTVKGPAGETALPATNFGTNTLTKDLVLPTSGAYTLAIDPQSSATGSVTIEITSGPSAPTITSSSHPNPGTAYESGEFAATWIPPGAPSGLAGYSVVIDDKATTVPAESVSQTSSSISASVEQGQWYLHVRAIDTAGFGGATAHFAFRYDVSGPTLPAITSASHPDQGKAYAATTFDASWEEPADPSGVAGYAVLVDASATTIPTATVTQTERAFATPTQEGTWYLHVRAVDGAGNWGATATFAFTVDTTGPATTGLASSTHPDPEKTYTSSAFVASWDPAGDPAGISGYAVVLDHSEDTSPGSAVTQTETSYSTVIGGGVWYLHVRAVDTAGNAGPAMHLRVNLDDAHGSGPTLITATKVTEDTVWGPQGSPYIIENSLSIDAKASLTLLPGTIIKFKRADRYGSITVNGQLLALGTPTQRVIITSYKDDTVGGDTNGDGAASTPARGDWYHVIVYGSDVFSPTTQRPVSVVDYADVRYGGYGSGVFMCSAYASIVAASKSRLIVSNSLFSESQWSNIHSTNTHDPNSFLGVYNNTFTSGNCGVVVRTGDIVGNTFENGFREYAFMSNSPDKVRFQYNTVRGVALVVGSAPTRTDADVRFNTFIGQTKDWPAANQDLTDYSLNWWTYDLNSKSLPACMDTDAMRAHNPPIEYTFTEACYTPGASMAQPTGYFTKVLPALSGPPGAIPLSLREAHAPRIGPVNAHSGALTYTVEDLAVEDAGKLLSAVRTYRSDRTAGSELGAGWFAAFDEKLSTNGDVSTLTSATGDLPFTNDAAAGPVPSAGVSAGFAVGASGSTVTTTDQTTYEFDLQGELTGMRLGDPGHKVDIHRVDGKLATVTGVSGRAMEYARADGRLQSVTDSQGRSATFGYTGGRVTSATGVDGKITAYAYDSEGRLIKVTTPEGRVALQVAYDAQGRVAWVEQPGTGRSTISYQLASQRTTVERADGSTVEYASDALGRVVQERIRGGAGTHTIYDGEGRVVGSVQGVPSVPMVRYSAAATATWFDGRGNPAMNVDAVGRTTLSTFNAKHKPLVTTRPDGTTITRAYDADGRLVSVTDPEGQTWTYTHNDRGQITSQTDPLGRATSITYEADGDLQRLTDTYGGTTSFTNDALGRPASITDAADNTRTIEYASWGVPRKVTQPRGGVTVAEFDDDRILVKATDPEGGLTSYEPDDAGRIAATVDPVGGRTTATFDALGRVIGATDARGKTYTRTLSPDGFPSSMTGPDGAVVTIEHDPLGRELRVIDALGNVTQQTFDRTGVLLVCETADGGVHRYSLDAFGQPTMYTAPDGGVWKTAHTKAGRVESRTDPLNRTTRWSYDAVGRTTAVIDPAGTLTQVAYDETARTATTTDPLGTVGTVTLDTLGRVVREVDANGGVTATTYDDDGNVATITDPRGGVTRLAYDLAGRLVGETNAEGYATTATLDKAGRMSTLAHPDGTTENFHYDANGNLVSRVDGAGKTWSYAFDPANRVVTQTDPLGHATAYAYDAGGRRTGVTDPTGRTETRQHDALGRVTAVLNPDGAAWRYVYNLVGNLTSSSDPAGVTLTWTLDKAGQVTRAAGGPNGRVDYTYDPLGRTKTRTDAASKATAYTYDIRSNLTKVTDALGQETTFVADAIGNTIERHSPGGRIEKWTYSPTGEVLSARDGAGSTSSYAYDKTGLLTEVTLPSGNAYTFGYDPMGRMTSQTTPAGAKTSFAYDLVGRLRARTLPSGDQVVSTWDDAGRLATEVASGVTRSFSYDDGGRMTQAVAGNSTLALTYNGRGLLATSTDGLGTTTYGYDAAQRLTSVLHPSGASDAFTYDTLGRISTIRGGTNLNYAYDAVGRLLKRSAVAPTSSYTTETRAYDALGRLLSVKSGLTTGYSTTATYTADSQIKTLTQTAGGNTASNTSVFDYDHAGRLVSEAVTPTGGETRTTTYTWDPDSNRKSVTHPDGSRVDSQYDLDGLLRSSSDGSHYTYDANGSLIDATTPEGARSFAYDAWGQLTGASVGGVTAAYAHDALGRTVARTSGGATERMGYAGTSSMLGHVQTGDGTTTSMVRDPAGALLAEATEGTVTGRVLGTIHGDVGAVLNASSGAVQGSSVFSAFGEASSAGSMPAPLGFQSMLTDGLTGLVDMGFRQYDPATGRFTSADDVIGSLTAPVTLNRYTYANADPLNYFDPDGHFGISLGAALDWVNDNIVKPVVNAVSSAAGSAANAVSSAVLSVSGAAASAVRSVWTSAPIREARSAASSTFKEVQQIANSATDSVSLAVGAVGGGHAVLDIAGMVPVVGEAFDVINGFWYLAEGDYLNAGVSLAAVVPIVGAGVAGAKFAARGYDAYRTIDNGYDSARTVDRSYLANRAVDRATVGARGAGAASGSTRSASPPAVGRPSEVSSLGDVRQGLLGGPNTAARACSFSAETLVRMADGTEKPISEVSVGDEVLATDPETGETAGGRVTKLWVHEDTLTDLEFQDGTRITTTEDHPFWSVTDQRFERADELTAGEEALTDTGERVRVKGLNYKTSRTGTAYNLTVDDIHTYYVLAGATPVLVHNTCEYAVTQYSHKAPGMDQHHGVMDVWAAANVAGYKSRAANSTTIQLSKANHAATGVVYRDWLEARTGRRVGAKVDWTSVTPREIFQLSESMFDAAKVPQEARNAYYSAFSRYIYGLDF